MATNGTPSVWECPVCFYRYTNPKVLFCGHTFCLDPCLRDWLQSKGHSCPLCGTSIQLPPSGKVEDLPTNFALQSMLEEQTTNIDESSVVHNRKEMDPIKQNKCSTHEEDFVLYCTVCSKLLCQKCLEEGHNEDHDTLQVQEALDRYCSMLGPVDEDLMKLITKLNDVRLFLEDAKKRYERECTEVKKKIAEVGELAIEEIRNGMTELYEELDKKETNKRKYHDSLEAKVAELLLSCESTHDMCDKMKLELAQMDFRKVSAIDSVTRKTSLLLKDMTDLEIEASKNSESIVFKPNEQVTPLHVGILNDHTSKGTKIYSSASKLIDLKCSVPHYCSYHGFSLLSPNSIVFLMTRDDVQHNSLNVLYRTGQSETNLDNVNIEGKISNVSLLRLNKLTKFLLLKNNRTPHRVVFNENDKNFDVTGSLTLDNALLYQINALTWDEHGENCYALLNDGETIKSFTFHPERRETFHVKLERAVKCSNSKGFHVSQFGMAICDEKRKRVIFYESTKSTRRTRAIAAPLAIPRWRPGCVTSLPREKKWYVLWNSSDSESSRVYQYSASFDEECVLLKVSCNIISFSFLDEKYISTDALTRTDFRRYSPSTVCVSVYQIKRS